jgi:hypothetical protein
MFFVYFTTVHLDELLSFKRAFLSAHIIEVDSVTHSLVNSWSENGLLFLAILVQSYDLILLYHTGMHTVLWKYFYLETKNYVKHSLSSSKELT